MNIARPGRRRGRRFVLGGLIASLLPATFSPAAGAKKALRPEILPWSDALAPPSFALDDDPRSLRPMPPDTSGVASRPRLQAAYVPEAPRLDGNLDDWPVVRWHDLRGGSTCIRGHWSGVTDAALDFSLAWTTQGLLLGAKLVDDSLDAGSASAVRSESVLLYIGSTSAVVTRYWAGGERAFRVWADGSVEAWTRWHNRRIALFDPAPLGARGAATLRRDAGGGGTVTVELFVPWDVLFPALPHDEAGLLVNVLVEDVDAGQAKLFSWSTRLQAGAAGAATRESSWAQLAFGAGPKAGTWIASRGTRHLEAGYPCEWSVWRWNGEGEPPALAVGFHDERTQAVQPPRAPAILRLHDIAPSELPWTRARRLEIDVLEPGGAWKRHDVFHLAPSRQSLANGEREVAAALTGRASGKRKAKALLFPQPEDIAVRLAAVAVAADEIGDWRGARHGERGILAWRAASWLALEERLLECQILRDARLGAPDAAEHERLVAALWPERAPGGYPLAAPFLRRHPSTLDGSIQPYVAYVSRQAALSPASPLLVVLHEYGDDAMSPFLGTALGAAVEARGWIAVSPSGRGNTGFALAGERDVLEVIDHSQTTLPVDSTRLYVAGAGMGASGAWLLSVRHADLFAAAAIVSGYADMDQPGLLAVQAYRAEEIFHYETMNPARLVRPGLSTAYRVVHSERDPLISVVHARVMAERLQEYGIPHEVLLLPGDVPGSVVFAEELDANLDYLAAHRRASGGVAESAWFAGTGGPVATVFPRGPFAVVYGTRPGLPVRAGPDSASLREVTGPAADARTADQFAQEWEAHFAARPPVLDDTRVDAALQEQANLVLVGEPGTHRLLASVADRLPVRYDGARFEVAGKVFDFREAGILFATANPAAPGRTLVVLSGMAERLGSFKKSLLKLGADYIVVTDHQEVLAIGHFGSSVAQPGPGGSSR